MEISNTAWMNVEALKARANLAAAGIDMSVVDTNSTRPTSAPTPTLEHATEQREDPARAQALGDLLNTVFKEY